MLHKITIIMIICKRIRPLVGIYVFDCWIVNELVNYFVRSFKTETGRALTAAHYIEHVHKILLLYHACLYVKPYIHILHIYKISQLSFVINGCLCFDYPTSEARKLLIGF